MLNEIIPIGSIVRLNGGKRRVMICGRFQGREGDDHLYDYVGCAYPEGILNPEELIFFDHLAVQEVFHIGYRDEEEAEFLNWIRVQLSQMK